jgi:erythromycin esterase
MKNAQSLLLTFLLLLFGCSKTNDENVVLASPEDALITKNIDEFNKLIIPMLQEPLKLTDADLAYFDDLKSAPIIGMGEATHGTKEFFQMKHRLFKYFVEHFNHKIFAFEMDFSEALIFDAYVQTGEGDIVQLMKDKMFFWTWNTSEVKDLLVWMKDYNIGKSEKDRVHIYGIDCQTFSYNVPELLKRVSAIDPKMAQDIKTTFGDLYAKDVIAVKKNIVDVNNLIKNNKANLIAKSSIIDYDFIEHISDIIIQTHIVSSNTGGIFEDRDIFMAENTAWLKNHTNFPMSVWAHNLHIKNTNSNSGDRAMGYHINNKIQGGYVCIGFSYANGSVTAYSLEEKRLGYFNFNPTTINDFSNLLLSKAKTPNFFYKTAPVYKVASLKEYFSNKPFYQIGAVFYPTPAAITKINMSPLLENNFNYMIHISSTHNSDSYAVDK